MIFYIIIAILFFGLLVGIHELGHFAVAKLCGIKVEEFAIGMGPAIFRKQKGETKYSLRIVPFGGFCAMTGEDGASDEPRAFVNQKPWKRLLVLAAGSFMNFLLGFILVFILYSGATAYYAPKIASFMDGCPYESSEGLHLEDRFYKIDGRRVLSISDVTEFLSAGTTHTLVLERDGKKVKLTDFAMEKLNYEGQERPMYGFSLGFDEPTLYYHLRHTWETTLDFVRMVFDGLKELFSGKANVNDLSGPVGIVDLMAETGEQAASTADAIFDIAYLGAFIAVNLSVMNMLPIPALDGGRIFFLLASAIIETITRKKLNPQFETYIHAAGMFLLLGLMGYVMLHDVVRIFTGG